MYVGGYILAKKVQSLARKSIPKGRGKTKMRSILVHFEDAEMAALKKVKGEKRSWHDFILLLVEKEA